MCTGLQNNTATAKQSVDKTSGKDTSMASAAGASTNGPKSFRGMGDFVRVKLDKGNVNAAGASTNGPKSFRGMGDFVRVKLDKGNVKKPPPGKAPIEGKETDYNPRAGRSLLTSFANRAYAKAAFGD